MNLFNPEKRYYVVTSKTSLWSKMYISSHAQLSHVLSTPSHVISLWTERNWDSNSFRCFFSTLLFQPRKGSFCSGISLILSKYLKTVHHTTKVKYKYLCGFISESSRSVGIHIHHCFRNPPKEHDRAIKYSYFGFSTNYFIHILYVHKAGAHPSVHFIKEKLKNILCPIFVSWELKFNKVKDEKLAASKILIKVFKQFRKIELSLNINVLHNL